MPTLHRYLLRQTLATCLLTVATFTLILLLGNVLKDVFDLVASGSLEATTAAYAVGLLIPFALAFALPIGLLTASLLVFSRLSVDQELTAIRAGGISLIAAVSPLLVLSVVLTVVSAGFNMYVAPQCRVAFNNLRDAVVRNAPAAFVGEGRFVELGNLTLYAREVRGNQLRDVLIYGTTNMVQNGITNRVRNLDVWAPEAEILVGTNGFPNALRLYNMQALFLAGDKWNQLLDADHYEAIRGFTPSSEKKPKLSIMSFTQLLEELRLRRSEGGPVEPVLVQLHKQIAFSFSCVAFTLVGIPLGIRVHRRETNIGVAIALAVLAVYYSFVILGQSLDTRVHLHPHLILWVPNILFDLLGLWLLARANRGG
jgi:lipopolysaccharide export system permease protein